METLNHVKPTMNESANLNMWVLSKLANETFAISRFLAMEQPGKCASKVLQRHIVNTHFRYQLRNVEFNVGIFLYWHKL